jgi:hypothetical protein
LGRARDEFIDKMNAIKLASDLLISEDAKKYYERQIR